MSGPFFTSWALWQKMVFVLAGAIVATIFVGLCKLAFDTHRIRKYSKVDKGKQAQTPEMLEAQPVRRVESKEEEIPFGIRAIESGIEVDGVWISRGNTPVGSTRSSINDFRLPRSHNSSQLELPQAIHSPSHNNSRTPSPFDLAVSAERIPDSRSSSPGRGSSDPRSRLSVGSNLRYSNHNLLRNSTALHALEGYDARSSYLRADSNNGQASSSSNSANSGSRSSDEADYPDGRPYEAAYMNNPRQSSTDPHLDLLQSHRLSHVAETGQLAPRTRRPGQSGEWASVADQIRSPQEISTTNGIDYFVPHPKTPSPPLPPVSDPADQVPGTTSSKSSSESDSSRRASRQAVPLLESYAPRARLTVPEAYQPHGPQSQYSYEHLPYEVQTSQNQQRESQVLRKVNSGFEILRPGTLQTLQTPSAEGGDARPDDRRDDRRDDKRDKKRLQKKRRSSVGSRASQFVEQV